MDTKKRNKIVTDNIGLVGNVLKKFNHNTMAKEEMYQAGCIGLIEAAGKYKGNYGVTFSTYATLNIRNHILKAIEQWNRFYRDTVQVEDVSNIGFEHADSFDTEHEMIAKLTGIVDVNLDRAVGQGVISSFEKELIQMRCGIGYYKRPASKGTISSICKLSTRRINMYLREAFNKLRKTI